MYDPAFLAFLGAVVAAAFTLIGVLISNRTQKVQADTQVLVDMVSESREQAKKAEQHAGDIEGRLNTKLQQQDDRIKALSARITSLETSERVLLDYAFQLRRHIEDRMPPPPPQWPDRFNH